MFTLQQLKDMEREEYKTLMELTDMKLEWDRGHKYDNKLTTESLEHSITWQQGRWGMLDDMIEELEKGDSQND